jgi:hypothetical protein
VIRHPVRWSIAFRNGLVYIVSPSRIEIRDNAFRASGCQGEVVTSLETVLFCRVA